jgi:hypothetical protein
MVELILPGCGASLVRLLMRRRGRPTRLQLSDGAEVTAWNCAWGMDFGRDWEHLTLNMSPRLVDADIVFVSSAEVLVASDPENGAALYRNQTTPSHSSSPSSGCAA